MPTLRDNVKKCLVAVGYVVLFFLVVTVIFRLIPPYIKFGLLDFFTEYKKEAGWLIWGALLSFFSYKLFKFVKDTEHPKQVLKKNLKKNIFIFFSAVLVIAFLSALFAPDYDRCDYYNQKLNGGVKEFYGRKYQINMCGTGGDSTQSNDKIRIQILDEKGNLLALRYFVVNWNEGGLPIALEYHLDHITYFNFNENEAKKRISMPPSTLDWIKTRLPFLN